MEADPPLFKKKKSRPTRTREVHIDGENSLDPSEESMDSPMTLATKLKKQHKARSKPQARLSFGVDEEDDGGDIFKVKKSELSKKIKLGNESPVAVPRPSTTEQSSQGPSYTTEYLTQLKAANAAPPKSSAHVDAQDIEAYNADDLTAMGMDDIMDGMSFASPNLRAGDTSETSLKRFPAVDESGMVIIPSGSSVVEAKKKRERMRAIGVPNISSAQPPSEEFISLSLTKRTEREEDYQGPHPESRLMREDDDLGDGEDELAEFTGAQERIALGKKAKKAEARRKREGMVEMIEDLEYDDDEETKEWETMQLRRYEGPELRESKSKEKPTYKPAPIPSATPILTLSESITDLTAQLNSLTASHISHTTALAKMGDERTALDLKETNLRKQVEAAEVKRAWFTDMRDWIESVADFLDAKFPVLEKLEEEHISLLSERYSMIAKRRQQDDEDDACLFLRFPLIDATDQVDELGRADPNASQDPRSPVREARRAARQRRHASHPKSTEDGFSTDSSLPTADADDYEAALAQLRQRINEVLSDVRMKDFKDPRMAIAARFADWRKTYNETYVGAWGGLGAVGAWEFWGRLEMVGWDPLRDDRSLDSFGWYSGLYDYSRPKMEPVEDGMVIDDDGEEPSIGPDGDLVTSMISTAVIPRLNALITGGAFDPYSAKDVRRIIDLSEQIEMSVSRVDGKYLTVVQAVTRIFSNALTSTSDLVSPALAQDLRPDFDPAAIPARIRFLSRRLKLLQGLLQWRKYASERFGMSQMVSRMAKDIMLPIALGGWDVGGKEIMQKVARTLPTDLAIPELTTQLAIV